MAIYGVQSDFRVAPELSFELPAYITGTAKLKAGTPVGGATNFLADETAELSATTDATTQGLLLHEADPTADGADTVAVMTAGIININRLDADVQALITDDIKAALPDITFIKR